MGEQVKKQILICDRCGAEPTEGFVRFITWVDLCGVKTQTDLCVTCFDKFVDFVGEKVEA